VGRLALTRLAAGFGLATKHSAILIPPTLFALPVCEVVRAQTRPEPAQGRERWVAQASRLVGAVAIIGIVAVAVLGAFYGFHFHPKAGVDAGTRVVEYAGRLKSPVQAKMIQTAARWRLLPQSYLYGLADVGFTGLQPRVLAGQGVSARRVAVLSGRICDQDDARPSHLASAGAALSGALAY
jgi:hypothetical protein